MRALRVMWVSLAAAFWASIVLLLSRGNLARALDVLDRFPRTPWDRERPLAAPVVISAALRALEAKVFGKMLFRTRCLKRSLVLYRLLRAHGHPAGFHLGVKPGRPPSESHAWTTLAGAEIPACPILGHVAVYSR